MSLSVCVPCRNPGSHLSMGVQKYLLYLVHDYTACCKMCDCRLGAACTDVHWCWEPHGEHGVSNSGWREGWAGFRDGLSDPWGGVELEGPGGVWQA